MSRGQHRALDDQNVGSGLLDELGTLFGASWDGGDGAWNARCLDRPDACADQLGCDRLSVGLSEDGIDRRLVRLCDLLDDRRRILIARVDAVEVEHRNSAKLAHRDRELDVDDAVHRGTPERKWKRETVTHRKRYVDLVGVERHAARHERDFVEPVSATRAPPDPDLEARLLPGNLFSGLQSALIQGVFTP